MHRKRKKPKTVRAGCLLCKPHKASGYCCHKNMQQSDLKQYQAAGYQLRCEGISAK